MKDFFKVSPLKILEGHAHKGLGKGNLGVLMAGAGLGKTSCLIDIALDKLFRGEKIVHVSLKDPPEKITSYYNVIFSDLVKVLGAENEYELRELVERNRIILAYLNESFDLARLRENLNNLAHEIDFVPESLIIDGIDFAEAKPDLFEGFKRIAEDLQAEAWFSALTRQPLAEADESRASVVWNGVDESFSVIIRLYSTESGVFLKLVKHHDREPMPETTLRLDPDNFLAMG